MGARVERIRSPKRTIGAEEGIVSARPASDAERSKSLISLYRSSSFGRLRQVGGPNSIDNFARSWQRAAAFPEVIPRRSSFVEADTDDELAIDDDEVGGFQYRRRSGDSDLDPSLYLSDNDDSGEEEGAVDESILHGSQRSKRGIPSTGLLASSPDRAHVASYGTISSRVSESARQHAIQLHKEQQIGADAPGDPDREPLLLKHVQHEDGTQEDIIVGQSTLPQTVFNSVNVLIGIGLLSLPLAMKHAGWVLGLSFLVFSAVTTGYTAKILAKCLDVDRSLVSYSDISYLAFGKYARLITSFLFCMELLGACVALVVLFADSLYALIPGLSILHWKIVCGMVLMPLNFLPLRFLSVTSILGIVSCTSSECLQVPPLSFPTNITNLSKLSSSFASMD